MRAFIAVDLPSDVRKALSNVRRELGSLTTTARWVSPESIHITLKFLGETQNSRIDEIGGALTGLDSKPFTVAVHGVGFFPGARSPRVFWAGLDSPAMPELALELDARMQRLGFKKEERRFRPHITLARAGAVPMDSSLVAAANRYDGYDFGSFTVDRFFLFRSTLKPAGAVYDKQKEYLL